MELVPLTAKDARDFDGPRPGPPGETCGGDAVARASFALPNPVPGGKISVTVLGRA
jgi:hypothetical protein